MCVYVWVCAYILHVTLMVIFKANYFYRTVKYYLLSHLIYYHTLILPAWFHTPSFDALFCFRSIIEPVRNTGFRDSAHFHLSYATDVDLANKSLKVTSVLRPSLSYTISYDKLVIGVGALSSTFGVPGVEEHAFFLKVLMELDFDLLEHTQTRLHTAESP